MTQGSALRCEPAFTVIEIMTFYDAIANDQKLYLKSNSDGTLSLDHMHAYYYQVQTQIFVCNVWNFVIL